MFEHEKDQSVLHLDRQQIETLLRNTRHGRLAFLAEGQVEIFPVNYAFDGQHLYFRTAPGAKLLAAESRAMVAFETDGILPDEGWSVVVRGRIAPVAEADVDYVRGLGLSPWVPTYKDFFVSLSIEELSGRHFIFARQPERSDATEFSYDPEQAASTPPDDPDPTRLSR
ncbi:pyridoxamine 5'-phosphate oxidase family protein [Yaniella flava]|uniref:Pyridoxamine 5'-phosphate oxidase family protein n=2 Tax=Yaniella flava TaxID=287930 RepID=A0ABN2UWE4_9MICC|nr:pyridoxamine 5'-phosphate oxidase family protein [Micrococcaceae bacterium]